MNKFEWDPVKSSFERDHVVATLRHFHAPGDLIEVRTKSQVFHTKDVEKAADMAESLNGKCDVWHLLNTLPENYLEERKCRIDDPGNATKSSNAAGNKDIVHRRCLLLDFDPVRERDIASTDAEMQSAVTRAEAVAQALIVKGYPRPTQASSGNGVHLTWHIDMAVTGQDRAEIDSLIRDWVHAVAREFSDAVVDVDVQVHNSGRLLKIHGTQATKGENTPARPRRYSRMIAVGDDLVVTADQIRAVIVAWGKPQSKPQSKPLNQQNVETSRGIQGVSFDMGRWLEIHGVGVREIKREDSRTIYVLDHCPFDLTHDGKDAAVFLGDDGKRGFFCFHNSCSKYAWPEFRALFDNDFCRPSAKLSKKLPEVQMNDRLAIEVLNDTVAKLAGHNDPPTLFQAQGSLLALRVLDGENLTLKVVGIDGLRYEAISRIAFVTATETKDGTKIVNTWPKHDLLTTVLEMSAWSGIPVCDIVTTVPLVAADGTIHSRIGYNPATRSYLTTDKFVRFDPLTISRPDADRAVAFLCDWPLSGFPFDSASSRVHALVALLQHFVMRVIDSNTPLYFLTAPVPGAGKGLLTEFIARVAGAGLRLLTYPVREEERVKTLSSTLADHPTHVLFDNVKDHVDSAALEGVLTSRLYTARILGTSKNINLPAINTTWMMAGNNATCSNDLMTRSCYIRLDPECERPTERTDFKIKNLHEWTTQHHDECVQACLTIIGHWVGLGMPKYRGSRNHRAQAWLAVMGGILDSIDLGNDFLANSEGMATAADHESEAWRGFVAEWAALDAANLNVGERTEDMTTSDLMDIAFGKQTFEGIRLGGPLDQQVPGRNGDAGRKTSLGMALRRMSGRVFAEFKIVTKADAKRGSKTHLVKMSTGSHSDRDPRPGNSGASVQDDVLFDSDEVPLDSWETHAYQCGA